MKKIITLLLVFSTLLFSQTEKEEISKHEKQIQDLISTISKVNKTLEKVKDEKSAQANLEELKKLQVELKTLKAKQKAMGNPPKELQEKIINKYAKSIFTEAQTLTDHINRIQSDSKMMALLKDILKDLKP